MEPKFTASCAVGSSIPNCLFKYSPTLSPATNPAAPPKVVGATLGFPLLPILAIAVPSFPP